MPRSFVLYFDVGPVEQKKKGLKGLSCSHDISPINSGHTLTVSFSTQSYTYSTGEESLLYIYKSI